MLNQAFLKTPIARSFAAKGEAHPTSAINFQDVRRSQPRHAKSKQHGVPKSVRTSRPVALPCIHVNRTGTNNLEPTFNGTVHCGAMTQRYPQHNPARDTSRAFVSQDHVWWEMRGIPRKGPYKTFDLWENNIVRKAVDWPGWWLCFSYWVFERPGHETGSAKKLDF